MIARKISAMSSVAEKRITPEEYLRNVLVWQDEYRIEHYRREGDQWRYSMAEGLDATLSLPAANCELPLREIYRQVELTA